MSDGLSISFSNADAQKRRGNYRLLTGLLAIIDGAMGLALLISPHSVSRLLMVGDPASTEWARLAGALLLMVTALLLTGRIEPSRTKLVNIIGMAGRLAIGLLLALLGGRLLWIGALEILAALALVRFYYRCFSAEVMSRP